MYQMRSGLLFSIIIAISLSPAIMAQDSQAGSQEAGTYRWQEGCSPDGKVCGSIAIKGGLALLSLTAHGVRVDIVLVDTGKLMLVAAAIGNSTRQPIFVLPDQFSLYDTESKPRKLTLFDPDSLARKKGKEALGDSNQIMTAFDLATSQISVNTGLSASVLRGPGSSQLERADSDAQVIREMALRADNIPPQKFVAGVVYFESDKKINQLLLSVPAGGYVFEFPFVRR